ncbi:AAA family ATPase [Actinoallomurus iriomotensis]|uniref:ABC transporter n=1 Tax=Actinoallomurus iriomotensis TaxID=478107 RepID=A0A9W6RSW4_9ACTN|nr:AAA family ATPase [Actinoallomurus iriomotensis]GLY79517.1 ABC transporter [Actinoallomurus iriomotensis]
MTPPADQGAAKHRAASLPLDEVLAELRDQIASVRFVLDAPGTEEAETTQQDLLNQLDDYVLPRVRRTDSPLLVVLSGSTGAGKSTLVNTLVGARVSATGVLRPTTSSPILVCHPDDADWWLDERYVLPGFGRVPGPAPDAVVGDQLVIMKSEVLPRGLALLDSPDVDSVFEDHHEFAAQFLAAADIWMCVTTAARYADAQVWRLLHRARDHGATLGIVLSRVPEEGGEEVVAHFAEMLKDNGLEAAAQFTIPETKVSGGMLPKEMSDEVQEWLTGITEDEDGRADVIRSTLGSVLDTFRTRVPELAKRVEEQVALRTVLRDEAEAAYAEALAELDEATRNGSLLRGEVLARWQDFAGTGDLERALQSRGGQAGHRGGRRRRAPARVRALKVALRSGLESLVIAAAERAAEDVVARWRDRPAGAKLLEGRADELGRASAELARRATRAVSSWQEHIIDLIRTEGVTKRSVAKFVSYDDEALSLVLMVGLLGFGTSDAPVETGTSAVPQRLLKALFGAESLRSMSAKARADLRGRIGMLYDEEAIRFGQALDGAGVPDETTPVQLYQATYNLEVAR